MSDETRELLSRFDPCQSYNIQTPNKEYKGRVQRTDFIGGHTFVEGLPKSAREADKVALAAKLAFFKDRGYHIEKSSRGVRDE